MFDSVPDGAEQFVGRDVDEVYADYFQRIREIAATGLVDCLSHLDLIKIHGHRPCRDIRWIVNETLDFIRSRDLAIEHALAREALQAGMDSLEPRSQQAGSNSKLRYDLLVGTGVMQGCARQG